MKSVLMLVAGWLCIVVGIAGLVLPFIPGMVLIVTGVMLLAQSYSWARSLLDRIYRRFPSVRKIVRG